MTDALVQDKFIWVLGRVHDQLGGPARTITGYIRGLKQHGREVALYGIGEHQSLVANFSEAGVDTFGALTGSRLQQFIGLNTMYSQAATRGATVVVVGVWHLSFFVIAMRHGLARLRRNKQTVRVLLVPTMSLSAYDWAKHRFVKLGLRPLVAWLLQGLDGVVFASTGELALSSPRSWRGSEVVMHPTTANIGERIERSEARYDVAFVGRIDPQKDLPLLFRGLAACARRHTLVVVGDGRVDYVSELQNLVRELGLEDQVSWLGWKSHSDALAVVRESKVVAVTSVVENFCHVALEAIANEAELVLVDRVMSSADFKKHAGVKVVPPTAEDVGSAITFCLQDWSDRVSQRRVDAEQISAICSPQNAAQRLIDFASTVRTNSVSCR